LPKVGHRKQWRRLKKSQANEKGTEAERGPGEAKSFFNKGLRRGNQSCPIRVYSFKEDVFFLAFPGRIFSGNAGSGQRLPTRNYHPAGHLFLHDPDVFNGVAVLHNGVNYYPRQRPKSGMILVLRYA
jgi:hypothetical protein